MMKKFLCLTLALCLLLSACAAKATGDAAATTAEPENPLARRRNVSALKSIRNQEPSLPPQQGPLMRSRGWKKKGHNKDNQ